ncbi:aldolase catalytic domain-containing protein [Halopseudomonas sp.]|uniref:aldolase catalytic domain-containing protein n=1 Tax=Halopseudomonas sp. TaxID=2901191 RepID=UPI0030010BA3
MLSPKKTTTEKTQAIFLDCTLRDGGYYNAWDFSPDLVHHYIEAVTEAGVDVIELGLRTRKTHGFMGAHAYTTDEYIKSLDLPNSLKISVMINASELLTGPKLTDTLALLFPNSADTSPVSLVRIACHSFEFVGALASVKWLKDRGFDVGFNLMQIADRSESEIVSLAETASLHPIDVLYVADSMGSMNPQQTKQTVQWLAKGWSGPIGVHTHDNLGLALANTLEAISAGATWVDSTVTGMGRGPGNARTEELAIELSSLRRAKANLVPLMTLIRKTFKPMQQQYGWGSNPYYYLTGKYGIHPTYIQEMLGDSRYDEEDVLSVIEYLKEKGGKKFRPETLASARNFYVGKAEGSWNPKHALDGRDVLLLGAGPGVRSHRKAVESYIKKAKPVVIALNTQSDIQAELIDFRIACHPVRLLADCKAYAQLPQPLIVPESMLPSDVRNALSAKKTLDFGVNIESDKFEFKETSCTTPSPLVLAYALAMITSGSAKKILMSGFDGYGSDDPRSREIKDVLALYQSSSDSRELVSITPTRYDIPIHSVYAM